MPLPVEPERSGSSAAIWLGIFGILLLLGGAWFWFYTTRGPGAHEGSTVQVAAAPPDPGGAPTTPQPSPTPTPVSTFVPAPTPTQETEVVPQNPDQAPKTAPPPAAPKRVSTSGVQQGDPNPPVVPHRADPPPPRPARQTSGVLHASVEVAQNGEVVFENLPAARLRFTFDHSAWRPTISHQANGTQTLVMRSLKAGIQRTCDVRWEIVE
jgi:hypothetical protein